MPRGRMMDMLIHRYPYGYPMDFARGGRRMGRRGSRGRDRAMGEDYARREYLGSNMGQYDAMGNDYAYSQHENENAREHYEPVGQSRMGYDYAGMRFRDGHYPMSEGKTYYPIEAMGTFNGYWGTPEQDYARSRGRMDYGYPYDYRGYDYAGDYGETLTKEELEHWKKKLMKEVDEKDKPFFETQMVSQKAKQMGVQMQGFTEEELALASVMAYTDYCMTLKPLVGSNMDVYIKLGRDWLIDQDSELKGGAKLAAYHDSVVMVDED